MVPTPEPDPPLFPDELVASAGERPVPGAGTDPDAEFRLESGDTVEQLLAEYQEACAWSRATAAGYALDDVAPHFRMGEVSLRWIHVHMIEETARHAGHAGTLREQLDGTTGT
jgi:Protein of unknown function (DUF664)